MSECVYWLKCVVHVCVCARMCVQSGLYSHVAGLTQPPHQPTIEPQRV